MKKIYFFIAILLIMGFQNKFVRGQCSDNKTFTINDIDYDTIQGYSFIKIGECQYTDEVGAPCLPKFILRYVVPLGAVIDSVSIQSSIKVKLDSTLIVYPTQYPQIGEQIPEFVLPDSNIYNSNDPFPSNNIYLKSYDLLMGYQIATIELYPVQYIPDSNRLYLISSINFTIHYHNNESTALLPMRISQNRCNSLNSFIKKLIENPLQLSEIKLANITFDNGSYNKGYEMSFFPQSNGIIPDYIIITNQELLTTFQELVDWKMKKGVPGFVITVEDIELLYTGTTLEEKIRSFIKELYFSSGPGIYLLLGADIEIIPTPEAYMKDLKYTDIDNDENFEPLMFIGRAPVFSVPEAQTFVNKVISYETLDGNSSPQFDKTYVKNILFTEGFKMKILEDEDTYLYSELASFYNFKTMHFYLPWFISDNCYFLYDNSDCLPSGFLTSYYPMTFDEPGGLCYQGDQELHSSTYLGLLNNTPPGLANKYFHINFHSDHSGFNSMGASSQLHGESININDVEILDNLSEFPYHQIVFSGGCNTATFSYNDCIGEKFILHPLGGATAYIGYFGAAQLSFPDMKGAHEHFRYFCDALYSTTGNPSVSSNLGVAFLYSYLNSSEDNIVLLGDPEMPVWTNSPNINGSITYTINTSEFYTGDNEVELTISNIPYQQEATVCFYKNNDIYFVKNIIGTGSGIVVNTIIAPNFPGELTLTITAQNFMPISSIFNVLPCPGIHLYVSQYTFDDTETGNGNGIIDAGEEIELSIQLSNSGLTDAIEVQGQLNNAQLEVSESFEGGDLPENWINSTEPYDWNFTDSSGPPSIDGTWKAYFDVDSHPYNSGTLKSPQLNLINSKIKFLMYHEDQLINNHDKIQLLIFNSDHPNGFEIPSAVFERYSEQTGWTEHIVDLSSYNTTPYRIGFNAIADGGNNLYIDRIQINITATITNNFNYSSFGDILAGTSEWSNNYFRVIINAGMENQLPLNLGINITAVNYSNFDEFGVDFRYANIFLNNIQYITEDGDQVIEAGEEVEVYIDLGNMGWGDAFNIEGNAVESCEFIEEIINSEISFGDIPSNHNHYCPEPFIFKVSNPLPQFGQCIFNGYFVNEYYKKWDYTINLSKELLNVENLKFIPLQNGIRLSWDFLQTATGYNIYRKINNSWIKLNLFNISSNSYTDTELNTYTTYEYRVCAINSSSIEGPPSEILAWAELPLHNESWPVTFKYQFIGLRTEGSPALGNIDNDPKLEIFLTSLFSGDYGGSVIGLNENGTKIIEETESGFYIFTNTGSSVTPAIADVNGDDTKDIIVSTGNGHTTQNEGRKVIVLSGTGAIPLWEYDTYGPTSKGVSVSYTGIYNDSKISCINYYDGENMLIDNSGNDIQGWPIPYPETGYIGFGMSAMADLNNDGDDEIIVGLRSGIYAYKQDGSDYLIQKNPLFAAPDNTRLDSPPVIADINNDGSREIAFIAGEVDTYNAKIYVVNNEGVTISGWNEGVNVMLSRELDNDYRYNINLVSVADINNDGYKEVFFASNNNIYGWNYMGLPLNGFPIQDNELKFGDELLGYIINAIPLIADIDSDPDYEIIIASKISEDRSCLFAYNLDGTRVVGFPVTLNLGGLSATPSIGDIDFDGKNEIVASAGPMVYAWDTEGDSKKIEWGSYRHDNLNTGNYEKEICEHSNLDIVINTNTEWGNKRVKSNVVVESGKTLEITGRVEFSAGSKIIIQRGGKLILDGGILTNGCKDYWQGIEVWGNSNQPQLATEQGWVEIINGGIIENSNMGIYTNRPDENSEGNWIPGYTGGMVHCFDAQFINNTIAVQFFGYNYQSSSYFTDCEFVVNDYYTGSQTPVYFAEVRGMNGVLFTNCEFRDETQYYNYLRGIYSFDSYIYVKGKCLNGVPCAEWDNGLFKNLYYGIYAIATTPNRFVDIRNTDFDNNFRGLYISGITNARVTSNDFKVNATFIENGGYGMYLNTSTGYHVEDNDFYSEGSTPIGVGLIVNNSGTYANEIYRNRFTNLAQGISAQENNGTVFSQTGLQILCNDFDICSADILVPKPKVAGYGLAPNQGSLSSNPENMAGNLFYIPSENPDGDFDDINNRGRHVTYYYPSNYDPGYQRVMPIDYTHNPPYQTVTLYSNSFYPPWSFEDGCPSCIEGGGGGTDLGELISKMGTAQQKIDSTENLLSMLIDGGNTEELQTEVDNSIPPEAYAIYTELIDNSPYLSDTVVSTAIEKESVLPDVMIRDVMVANPHTAKNDELLNKLDERWTPLPEYMKEQIIHGRDIISMMEKTVSKLSRYKLEKARAINTLEHKYKVNGEPDSLKTLLESDSDLESKYRLAFLNIQDGDWNQGMDILTELPSLYELSKEEQDEHEALLAYCGLLESTGGLPVDSLAVEELWQIMEMERGAPSMFALNYLIDLNEVEYEEPIQLPEILKSSKVIGSFTSNNINKGPTSLKITPNPAKEFVIIEFELETPDNAVIEIHDVTGRPVYYLPATNTHDEVTLDTRTWDTGIYVAALKINGKIKETVKFSISY